MNFMMCKASAWYYVAYKYSMQSSKDSGTSFPWNTCYDYLNRVKVDYELRTKKSKVCPLAIVNYNTMTE